MSIRKISSKPVLSGASGHSQVGRRSVNRRKKACCGIACAIAALFLLCSCSAGLGGSGYREVTPEYVLTYAENQAADYPTSLGAYRFAELVEERSGGRIKIMVKAAAALGDEKTILEQLQFGGVDFARVSLSALSDVVPQLNVLQMPYLYTSREHMWKVLDGEIGDRFMEFFDTIQLEPLSWYDGGVRNFYTSTVPIRCLEDMQGLRIRVQQSGLMMDIIETLGARAVPTAFEDVYSALQKGEIDGAENNWPSYESEHHYEVARYYTLDEHTRVPEMQLASQVTWDKLSYEDQEMIRECAKKSAEYQRTLWTKREKSSEKKVQAEGCERIELSNYEKEKFRQAMEPVYIKYCADYLDLVDAIRNAAVEEQEVSIKK